MDSETATAFNHAFAALGAGSAMWQGSHTYLGNQADNQLTSVVAFLIHHAIVGGLAETGGHLDIDHLINLQAQPRLRTVVQTASDITSIFTSQDISEWAQEFVDLDVPVYESTFVVIISSIITTMFPDRDATALLTGLTNIFRGNPEELNIYLPILRDLLVNLNLSDEKKFVLFWQLLGVACKMVFAFLWQEKVIQIDLFLEPGTNELGPKIMPSLVSLFNFVTEFEHVDESFQKFEGMFPGDKACRETVPHSKWHELSASALLDTVYLSDCLAAVVTGSDGFGCAHLSNLESSTEITRSEVSDWVNTNIVVPKIPIVKDVVPLFIEEIFMLFDLNDNDKIEWIDIEKTLFQTLSNQSLEQSKVSFRELRTFAPPTKVTAPPLTNSVTHFNLAVEKSEKMACSPASRTVNLLGSMR
jgi:hypothetical protein